jgi:hypothetical protein
MGGTHIYTSVNFRLISVFYTVSELRKERDFTEGTKEGKEGIEE